MVLTYSTYRKLIFAIDEYTNWEYSKNYITNIIFKHYITRYKSFIAENKIGYKKLIRVPLHRSISKVMKDFREYMRGCGQ